MDGQGLVLCLMDGLRNGPYRMCHTASGDVSMRHRGEGRFSRLCGGTRGGERDAPHVKSGRRCLNLFIHGGDGLLNVNKPSDKC